MPLTPAPPDISFQARAAPTPPSLAVHVVVGAVQGIAVWLLYEGARNWGWSAAFPRAYAAALSFCVAGPLAWYLTHDAFASDRVRRVYAALVGVLFGALGAHTASVSGAEKPLLGYFEVLLPASVLGFLLVSLAAAWDVATRRFDYPRFFVLASRNAMLALVAVALTAALWVVLAAGARLMESIGLYGLRKIYSEPAFAIPVTSTALGLSFALALTRANVVVGSQLVALSLGMWFLPMTLAFALAWVAALPFTGVQPLFRTGNAALYLLWSLTLSIVFLNAAFRDGRDSPSYAKWLARFLTYAWLATPVLSVLAGWALWERVAQHGWTPERIWAAVVWAVVTVCAVGYAASVRRQGVWMHSIAATNIVAAIVQVVVILALISPVADVHRLAVADQVGRLRAGVVPLSQFDWKLLLHQTGRYGIEALERLAQSGGATDSSKAIARQAADILRTGQAPSPTQDSAVALQALRERIAIRPSGMTPDPGLLEWLARPAAEWHERNCVTRPDTCALWITDLDRDGKDDAILLWDQKGGVQGALYSRASGAWRKEGALRGSSRPLSMWLADIDAGSASITTPKWPDLTLGGERIRIAP